jgi:hypothetical protein
VACMRSGISGWVIGLLIRGRAGAERRAANAWSPWSPVLADGEAAAASFLDTRDRRWRSSSATAARNSWPEGSLRMWLALCWILESAARDRSLNLLGNGAALTRFVRFLARAREGGPLG